MHNDDEKKNLLLEQIKKAVYLRLELWKTRRQGGGVTLPLPFFSNN